MLLGSYDAKKSKPSLHWVDYLAASVELPYAAHGYASYYVLSLLDRHHRPDLTLEEGLELTKLCVEEIKRRIPLDFKGIQVCTPFPLLPRDFLFANPLLDKNN